jgi:16S rRNA (guanine527-N7)-methyltransferase
VPVRPVPRETREQLERFSQLVLAENERQNLIAASTMADFWNRHILDSLQLIEHAPATSQLWLDIGSGAGLPGIVIAIATEYRVVLAEPRRRRADFLAHCREQLGLANVVIEQRRVEKLHIAADVISARAVASLDTLFGWAEQIGSADALMILPRGVNAVSELEAARAAWHGDFDLAPSATAPGSGIVLARHVRRRNAQ